MDILLVLLAILLGIPTLALVAGRLIIGHWPWTRCNCRDPHA